MKKFMIGLGVVAVLLGIVFIGMYNGQINADETVIQAQGDVDASYQRRNDLIPNLVETVRGSANHEEGTLTAVIEARASVNNIEIDFKNATPEQLQQYDAAQQNLGTALSRLLVTVERYPDLKANQQFADLMVQLEGTENRIQTARIDYNEAVATCNKKVRGFFGQFIAGFTGVEQRDSFEASQGAEVAPDVDFSSDE